MRSLVPTLAVAALVSVAVGLLTADAWVGYVIGAVFALSLWVMLFAGSCAAPPKGVVSPASYAVAALVGVALGYLFFRIGDSASFWAVGFIMAGAVLPAASMASRDGSDR